MTTNKTIVRLKIRSANKTPEAITALIGLQCDDCWRSGDKRRQTSIVERDNGWVLHSMAAATAELSEQIEILLNLLAASKEAIRDLSEVDSVEFSIVLYRQEMPALNFDSLTLRRLAELGANMDIDLYVS